MNLNQPFVHCGVCHVSYTGFSSSQPDFWLTSCAHILCTQHIGGDMLSPKDLTKLKLKCPICHVENVSVLPLQQNNSLPQELTAFFQPLALQLENLYSVAQFQICGTMEQCEYYSKTCLKLQEKCNRQRQLLYNAREELNAVARYKERIKALEDELEALKRNSTPLKKNVLPYGNVKQLRPPPTVDLTRDDIQESFISKLKKSSSLKKFGRASAAVALDTHACNDNDTIIAESTKLNHITSLSNTSTRNCSNSSSRDSRTGTAGRQFPSALEKLRIVKRNNTSTASTTPGKGLFSHMRSSSSSSSNMQKNTVSAIALPTSKDNTRFVHGNKFRRIR